MKGLFNKFNPKQKKLAVVTIIVGGLIALLTIGYMVRGGEETTPDVSKGRKISLDPKLLEKAYSENIRKELDVRNRELDELKDTLEGLKKRLDENTVSSEPPSPEPTGLPSSTGQAGKTTPGAVRKTPPPPSTRSGKTVQPSSSTSGKDTWKQESQVVGGIEVVSFTVKKEKEPSGKKDVREVYLPPSFMEATLLTGFSAATMQSARTYEKPLLLRVKDIAVLPNDVKSDLKGCFVIASAYGDLSDERAHVRLVSLTCISKTGESVIDTPVKGFIVDSDGKIGLAGNVVTRAGALLGRAVIAGFFGGIGDAIKASTTTQSISALGATQTLEPGKILEAGIGGGLSEGFDKMQDFYLEMAKQTFPVIEVGALKTVTVVIEEGVELGIKDYCIGGFERCHDME